MDCKGSQCFQSALGLETCLFCKSAAWSSPSRRPAELPEAAVQEVSGIIWHSWRRRKTMGRGEAGEEGTAAPTLYWCQRTALMGGAIAVSGDWHMEWRVTVTRVLGVGVGRAGGGGSQPHTTSVTGGTHNTWNQLGIFFLQIVQRNILQYLEAPPEALQSLLNWPNELVAKPLWIVTWVCSLFDHSRWSILSEYTSTYCFIYRFIVFSFPNIDSQRTFRNLITLKLYFCSS